MTTRPASAMDVALFLAHLSSTGAKSICAAAASAISWNHSSLGFDSPCNTPIVRTMLAGAKRSFAATPRRAEPMSIELVRQLVAGIPKKSSLMDYQFYFYVLISFFGFFRYNDITRLAVKDFKRKGPNMVVEVGGSKTDKFRAGSQVFLSAMQTEPLLCPVRVSTEYFELLFKNGYKIDSPVLPSLTVKGKLSSASTLTRKLRSALQGLVLDPSRYTLHSFRAGGATTAANANISRDLIAIHGRWQSDAVNAYIKQDDKSRFSVSKSLIANKSIKN